MLSVLRKYTVGSIRFIELKNSGLASYKEGDEAGIITYDNNWGYVSEGEFDELWAAEELGEGMSAAEYRAFQNHNRGDDWRDE